MGNIADGVEIAQGSGEQLRDGKVLHLQQRRQIGLRLGGGEADDDLFRGGPENPGILGFDQPGQGSVWMIPQPDTRLDEMGEHPGELGLIAAGSQGEKLVEKAGNLIGPQPPAPGGSGEVGDNGLVIISGQHPRPGFLPGGVLPGPAQKGGCRLGRSRGGLQVGAPGQGPPGFGLKGRGGLCGPDIVPVPMGDGATVETAVLGTGKKLCHKFLGPSPAFQKSWGPKLA